MSTEDPVVALRAGNRDIRPAVEPVLTFNCRREDPGETSGTPEPREELAIVSMLLQVSVSPRAVKRTLLTDPGHPGVQDLEERVMLVITGLGLLRIQDRPSSLIPSVGIPEDPDRRVLTGSL